MPVPRRLIVRVPASTSNLGPGYDCLGLAFQLYNTFNILFTEPGSFQFETDGPERIDLPRDADNLFIQGARRFWETRRGKRPGRPRPMPGFRVRATLHVPAIRGLGSSSTALLAGLVAANAFAGSPCSREELLDIAGGMEGHPDNVTPSLMGGLCAGVMNGQNAIHFARYRLHRSVGCVVVVPDYPVPTVKARKAIPSSVPHGDAVFNLTRVPLVVDRLVRGRLDDLGLLMEDRLHEPYRKGLLPGFDAAVAAGRRAGAAAVVLSGAGSAMVAFYERKAGGEENEKSGKGAKGVNRGKGEKIGRAMVRALRRAGHSGKFLLLEPDYRGTRTTGLA